ncbi:hypothetical protein ABBQ38_008286 [Trebouxia sp. C0009 RCD-2024]
MKRLYNMCQSASQMMMQPAQLIFTPLAGRQHFGMRKHSAYVDSSLHPIEGFRQFVVDPLYWIRQTWREAELPLVDDVARAERPQLSIVAPYVNIIALSVVG